jgi:lipoate-protein ligase A
MFHGTLLFDINIDTASKVLNVKADKIESKGIKSVKARMGNIKTYLPELTVGEFKDKIIESFEQNSKDFVKREINQSEIQRVKELYESKFSRNEWNFGYSPKCNFHKYTRLACGGIDINLNIEDGYIRDCKIYGDFLGIYSVDAVENALKGKLYNIKEIREELGKLDLSLYFGPVTVEELLDCIF